MPDEPRATDEEHEEGPERIEQEEDMRGPAPADSDPQSSDPMGDDDE